MKKFKDLCWLVRKYHLLVGNVDKVRVAFDGVLYSVQITHREYDWVMSMWTDRYYFDTLEEAVAKAEAIQQQHYRNYKQTKPDVVWRSK